MKEPTVIPSFLIAHLNGNSYLAEYGRRKARQRRYTVYAAMVLILGLAVAAIVAVVP